MHQIDKKWKQPAEFITKTRMYLARKALISYMNSFALDSYKKEVMKWWPELYAMYAHDNGRIMSRGMNWTAGHEREYYDLIRKVSSTGAITSKTIRSWTAKLEVAFRFAYYYMPNTEDLAFDRKSNAIMGMVISAGVQEGEGLDLIDTTAKGYNAYNTKLKTKFLVNEYEMIMPPGKYWCAIISAAFLAPNNTIYQFVDTATGPELHNDLAASIKRYCEKKNRIKYYEEPEYTHKITTSLDKYIKLFKQYML